MQQTTPTDSTIQQYASGIPAKAALPRGTLLAKAILAGAMIAIGASASSVAAHTIGDVGLARLLAGCVFPVGLMMVVLLKAELFTGDCMMVLGINEHTITLPQCAVMLAVIYAGNMLGSLLVTLLVNFSGQLDFSGGLLGAYTIKVAAGKTGIPFVRGLASGVMCNILVCGAVLMATEAKDITGKLLCCFFVIMAFVVSGFEHCVANMYYIPAGLLCKLNPAYVQAAMTHFGVTEAQLAALDLRHFLVNNLVPVTIGNIIGGAFFVALPMYSISKPKAIHEHDKQEEFDHGNLDFRTVHSGR